MTVQTKLSLTLKGFSRGFAQVSYLTNIQWNTDLLVSSLVLK